MPTYKLTYFDTRGLAEPIRLAFHYGGIPFIDNQVKRAAWDNVKDTFPVKKVPILELNGQILTQSPAILKYIAKKAGLVPEDELEAARADELCTYVYDVFFSKFFDYMVHFDGIVPQPDREVSSIVRDDYRE